ncbi:MAG TPA: DUF2341 domain-containing protein [Polyangium sp.]|nr:DUF2341 domain-containing protein [Polyangium sp.]
MNRLFLIVVMTLPLVAASACLNLSTTESTGSSSSGAGGNGGEGSSSSSASNSSSSGAMSSSSSSSSSSSGTGGAGGGAGSPLPGWSHRRAITVAPISTPVADYMLMLPVAQDSVFGTDAQLDGDDLVFTDSDGTTILPHEFEYYKVEPGMANFVAWIRVPQIPMTGKTIYVYYGNSFVGPQQNNDLAWVDFAAVYHLYNNFNDSTGLGHNGVIVAPAGPDPATTPGVIANGVNFPGGSFAEVPNSPDFNLADKDFTISLWLASAGADSHALDHYLSSGPGSGWRIATANATTDFLYGGTTSIQLTGAMSTGTWHHVAVVKSLGMMRLYVDGVETQSKAILSALAEAQAPLYIGTGSINGNFYVGGMDEVRIAPTNRTVGWLETEIVNATRPDQFVSLGAPESF